MEGTCQNCYCVQTYPILFFSPVIMFVEKLFQNSISFVSFPYMCSEFEIEVNDKLLEPVSSGKFRSVVIKRNIADSCYIYI
jgi:hypothetical protein